jgi:hypothetical protein
MKHNQTKSTLISACLLIIFLSGYQSGNGQPLQKQGPPVPGNFCISNSEIELYQLINEYRKSHNLPPVPLSKSLSHVAALHARDLFLHHPDQGACNFHSWSDKGKWTPFCYPKDETKKSSVWDKPRELTKYPSKAYEIVYWENNPLVKDTIIMVWETEDYFNSFLLNTGKWQGKQWNAIGIAVYENYACAWFGEVSDPEGEAYVCGTYPSKQKKDSIIPPVRPAAKTVKQELSVLPHDSLSVFYSIIIKSGLTLDAATKMVASLKSGEYPDAKTDEKEGKFRISVYESPDKASAMKKLKVIKMTYKDAWLLKR